MNKVTCNLDSRGLAEVCLNRPAKHNAFDDEIIGELLSIFSKLSQDSSIRLVVLRAEGKSFSAGGDLAWMKKTATYDYEKNLVDARSLANLLKTLNTFPQPVIARVQGAAYGGAVGLLSCCDIVVATDTAGFALSEVKVGLVPATISPYVIQAIGARSARRLFITGERIPAQEAQRIGLVSEVVAVDDLDEKVELFVENVLSNGPEAVQIAKKLVRDIALEPITDELIEHTAELIAQLRVSTEGQEGLAAFLEKRRPNW